MKNIPKTETPAAALLRPNAGQGKSDPSDTHMRFDFKGSAGRYSLLPRRLSLWFAVCIAAAAIAATAQFARVSSQTNKTGVEITSPSGLREKPATLADRTAGNEGRSDYSTEPIPDDIVYGQIFRHLEELGKKADGKESQGRDGRRFRDLYRNRARLTEIQARTLGPHCPRD